MMGLEVLLLLIPLTFLLALLGLGLFLWAIHNGQMDDLETPAIRAIFDDGTEKEGSAPRPRVEGAPQKGVSTP